MRSDCMLRLLSLAGCCLLLVSCQEDATAAKKDETAAVRAAGAVGADGEAAAEGEEAQSRFFFGLDKIVDFVAPGLNPCNQCSAKDQKQAATCCQEGGRFRKCCSFILGQGNPNFAAGGFQPQFPGAVTAHNINGQFGQFGGGAGHFGGGVGHFGGGAGHFGGSQFGVNPGFHGQNSFRPHGGHNSFQHGIGQPGFGNTGFNSFGSNTPFVGASNTKPGFCPQQGLFGPVNTRSGAGAAASDDKRTKRQAPEDGKAISDAKDAAADDGTPNTRFLFGLGGCRDECFNDADCFGNLKCCKRSCRECTNPDFF